MSTLNRPHVDLEAIRARNARAAASGAVTLRFDGNAPADMAMASLRQTRQDVAALLALVDWFDCRSTDPVADEG